jgi:hypothetical protein
MDNISIDYCYNNSQSRKSSCATVVPPTPLRINCKNTGPDAFYDTNSMNDTSPTIIASSRKNLPKYNNFVSSSSQSVQEQKSFVKSAIKNLMRKLKGNHAAAAATVDYHTQRKLGQEDVKDLTSNNKVIRHSYSDSHLSPGSTAVGDDEDEERNGYIGPVRPVKKKNTPRGWIAAVLMIIFGALIAVTFVLVGLGKALGGNTSSVANAQQEAASNSTTTALSSSILLSSSAISTTTNEPTATVPSIPFIINTTVTNQPTPTTTIISSPAKTGAAITITP